MKKIKSKLKNILSQEQTWYNLAALFGAALLLTLLWFRLGSLTYGNAADTEISSQLAAMNWHSILTNPLNAPYNLIERLVILSGHTGITSLRLVSTFFAAVAALLFYIVARGWHNMRVALLASWLFVSSSWFLHLARLGSPEILWLVSILAIVVVLTPNRHGRQTSWALPSTLMVLSILLYIPGMVWLVLAGGILQRKNIREAWQATAAVWLRVASLVGSVIIVAPLGYALARTPMLVYQWLGLPDGTAPHSITVTTVAHNLIGVPRSLLLDSSFDSVHWLGALPLLSSFEIVMFLLGVYFYATHIRAARTRLIVALALVGWILVAIIGLTAITLVVPVVYLLVAAGVAYILHLWLRVFPNNPVARTVGVAAIMLAILMTSVYQTRSYFVAWRYNTQTSEVFTTKLR